MNLHKAKSKADWYYVKKEDRNFWQKTAAASGGILAPANAVTLTGAILVLAGLVQISDKLTLGAILFIVIGRLADIADGYVANKTGTKSPLGEVLDVTADKVLALATVTVLLFTSLVPVLILGLVAAQSLANGFISIYAKSSFGLTIHPAQSGKLAVAASWTVLASYLFYHLLEDGNNAFAPALLLLAWLFFAAFVYFGVSSTISYYKQLPGNRS